MTVQELRERLSMLPADATVVVRIGSREKEAYDVTSDGDLDFIDNEVVISGT